MVRLWFMCGVWLCAFSATSLGQPQDVSKGVFGLGAILGEPTGISAKLYLNDDTAIAVALGHAFAGRGLQVHGDFLWHPWILSASDPSRSFVLPAYVGVGARILRHDRTQDRPNDTHLGARLVVGVMFDFVRLPIDVFAEIAGVLDYRTRGGDDHNGIALDVNGGAGVRYYF